MGFLRWFVVSAAIGFLLLIGLLILINPHGEFGGERFPQPSPDYHAIKLRILNEYAATRHADGVILGSSRSGKLDPEDLKRRYGFDFFSMTVLGADAEDYLATWRLFVRREGPPKIVFLGLDNHAFGANDIGGQFVNNLTYVSAFNGTEPTRLKRIRHTLRLVKKAVNPEYLYDAGLAVWGAISPPNVRFVFRDDGYLEYREWDRLVAAGEFDRRRSIDECSARFRRRLLPVDPGRLKAVEGMLREAKASHTRVIVWLTPFHPTLYAAMENDPRERRLLTAFRAIGERLATEYGVEVVDFSRIESYQGDPDDWYDCLHFGRENARRIEAALANKVATP
jgi:lysophospholipase L1-like esterase